LERKKQTMAVTNNAAINKPYLLIVLLLMLVLPMLSVAIEFFVQGGSIGMIALAGKWFLFWAVGMRLFTAGIKQAINPAFTAKTIFHINNEESFILVRELGFANICMGAAAIIALFCPQWRMAAVFTGGLYFGIAGAGHIIKKPVSGDEWLAMVSDIFIFGIMALYLLNYYI
jgi:hypothetical protein